MHVLILKSLTADRNTKIQRRQYCKMKFSKVDRQTNKYLHLEVMRIFAIFWVIFNHTGLNGFFLFSQRPVGGVPFWIYLFVSVFCKFPVPLFFAISGALRLNRPDESLKKLWFGKILKIAIILLVYSAGYYLYDRFKSGKEIDLNVFIIRLYSSTLKFHLWYLYLYIAYLAVIPFLKSLVKNLDDKYFYYMLFIAVFFDGILPSIEYLIKQGEVTINNNIKISWLINSTVLYPCLGYFMQHRLKFESLKKYIPWLCGANVLGIMISCYMTYYKGLVTGVLIEPDSQAFHSSFVAINCVTIFLIIRMIFERRRLGDTVQKIILSVGSCTFGIYLWHIWIIERSSFNDGLARLKDTGLNNMICILLMCLMTMIISYIITLILSKIPVIKKLVDF